MSIFLSSLTLCNIAITGNDHNAITGNDLDGRWKGSKHPGEIHKQALGLVA